ncbi:hypothetical protein LTR53_005457 [Teratosphaeriaceae sp. CCFEE 6253]|nr:hypothetical protein LTR53_005457 [Teratosphaeriaceae sp. CCFEE 6253]
MLRRGASIYAKRDHVRLGQRRYATAFTSSRTQTVKLQCQSNGYITLDIHHPPSPPTSNDRPAAVLICLPPGPLLQERRQDPTLFTHLQAQDLPFPVVQLNYRLDRAHPYPGPIHDVLQGYDWIKAHLLPRRAIQRIGRSPTVGKVAVCGEFIGGGLAAMLALTECRVRQPGIVAAALSDPVVDWVDAVADSPRVPKHNKALPNPADALADHRRTLFRKPEHYFDPFASPLLFLRSPGRAIPPAPPDVPLDEMAHLSLLNRESHLPPKSIHPATAPLDPPPKKTAKRYPSPLLGLRLPAFHIYAGRASPLLPQAEEFSRRLRQAHVRQAGEGDGFGRKVLMEDEAEGLGEEERREMDAREGDARERVGLSVEEGFEGWEGSPGGRERVEQMVRGVRGVLGAMLDLGRWRDLITRTHAMRGRPGAAETTPSISHASCARIGTVLQSSGEAWPGVRAYRLRPVLTVDENGGASRREARPGQGHATAGRSPGAQSRPHRAAAVARPAMCPTWATGVAMAVAARFAMWNRDVSRPSPSA